MAGGWGGARPGSGRKTSATLRYQESRRRQVEKIITPADWEEIVKAMMAEMKGGNFKALAVLLPFIVGAAPKPPEEGADQSQIVRPDL